MYDPIKVTGEWRIRYNHELYQIYKELAIIQEIEAKRVRRLRQLFGTKEPNPCTKLTLTVRMVAAM
jgi:uncharacterized protein YjaZ